MKIVLTTQPTITNKIPSKSLLVAKQPDQSLQQPAPPLQQPFLTAPQPSQLERVITLFHQPQEPVYLSSPPLVQYKAIESIENRLALETLVGVDIYV